MIEVVGDLKDGYQVTIDQEEFEPVFPSWEHAFH
jgi:hypothetical protein